MSRHPGIWRNALFCLALMLLFLPVISAQVFKPYGGPILENEKDRIAIPFEYRGNLIVVDVIFNRIFPLKFVFDTGAEHSILTRREITDLLAINYERKFTLYGADLTTELTAYLARGISLQLSNLQLNNRSMLVLEEDYFNFDEFNGLDIHGILGADVFRRYVVEINFSKKMIYFLRNDEFQDPGNKFKGMPIEVHRSKPYMTVDLRTPDDSLFQGKLLVDSGSSLPLIIYPETAPELKLPENVVPAKLGRGLGGDLEGFVGRISEIHLGESVFRDIVTSFQAETPLADSNYTNNRHGILGTQALQHFNIVIDYYRERIYLRPLFRKGPPTFKYDKSGLFIVAGGTNVNKFKVAAVVPGSPAEEAGLQRGDDLKRINWLPTSWMSLATINRKFKKKEGKTYIIVFERDGEKMKTELTLRKLI